MRFEEIFHKPGMYVADSFAVGVAFEISESLELHTLTYKSQSDMSPERYPTLVYAGLFHKSYRQIFSRQALFNEKYVESVSDLFDRTEESDDKD